MVIETFSEETPDLVKSVRYDKRVVFTSKEECQKCCDWLNEENKRKETGK